MPKDILGLVVTSEQVVDGVRVANGSLQRVLVAEVDLHGDDLSEIAHDLQVAHIILVTVGNNDVSTLTSYMTCRQNNVLANCLVPLFDYRVLSVDRLLVSWLSCSMKSPYPSG